MKRQGKVENFDPQLASSNSYNDHAGGQKNLSIGPKLDPITIGDEDWTTDVSTVTQVPSGSQLAIFNTSEDTVRSVRFGQDNTVTAGNPGEIDANGNVAIPCPPLQWVYLTGERDNWIISNSDDVLVFIIRDHTRYR